MSILRAFAAASLVGVLSGCASLSPDGGMSVVVEAVRADIKQDAVKIADVTDAARASSRSRELLRKGLTVERAVQIALLNNKGLQAAYNELGVSEAKFVQASLPPNPAISISRMAGGFELEIERRLVGDLLAVLTLPARREIAQAAYRKAELDAIAATLRLATDVRRQYWRTVGANAQAAYLLQARAAAEATSELARKLGETGAMNKIDQAREHAFTAEISAQLARARTQQRVEKERLTRLMGLWDRDAQYAVPSSLPPLPRGVAAPREIETKALSRRIDLKIARAELDRTALELGLTDATRFVHALEFGVAQTDISKSTVEAGVPTKERERLRGVEISLEIPIFDFGAAKKRDAEQTYMRNANRFAEKAVNVRSEAREAWQAWRGAYDVARIYQSKVLPLRKQIQSESLLHYNGMTSDVFVLLQDARARISSNMAALDARRDFLIAGVDLGAALLSGNFSGASAKAEAVSAPAAGGADH